MGFSAQKMYILFKIKATFFRGVTQIFSLKINFSFHNDANF